MLARSVKYVAQVLEQQIPVKVSEVYEDDGDEVKLRGTLFPLSTNGRDIDAVLGAANCARLEDLRLNRSVA